MKSQLDLSFSAKEKVNHKVGTNLRMFINRLHSDFPPHWHTDIEIIIPKEAPYRVVCGNQTYDVEIDDILMICPAVLHEIFSPTPGARVYIQADFSGIITLKEIEKAFRLMSPALHIKKKSCPTDVYDRLCKYIDKIIEDIKFLHKNTCLDMNDFNFMIGFDYNSNGILHHISEEEQLKLYDVMHKEFDGTDLDAGVNGAWFAEFGPEYCSNCDNC